jgi:hypothetical protein
LTGTGRGAYHPRRRWVTRFPERGSRARYHQWWISRRLVMRGGCAI